MCNRLIKFFCLCRHPGKDQGPVVWSSLLFVWDMLLKRGCLSMKFKLWLWWKPDCSLSKAFYSRAGLMLQLALWCWLQLKTVIPVNTTGTHPVTKLMWFSLFLVLNSTYTISASISLPRKYRCEAYGVALGEKNGSSASVTVYHRNQSPTSKAVTGLLVS